MALTQVAGGLIAPNATITTPTITSPTVSGNLSFASGTNGIVFNNTGATTNSTLNDYETGTWTPSVGGTANYITQNGTYTKVGRVVTCEFEIQINAIGTGSTTNISGLPFTSNSQTNGKGGSIGYFSTSATSLYFLNVRLDASSTTLLLASTNAATTQFNTSSPYFQNNTRVLGSITYNANF